MHKLIILAAGASRRMGSPKQLLQYKGKSLLRRTTDTALAAALGDVIVVLGANANQVKKEVENTRASIITNHNWAEGIASSITTGLQFCTKEKEPTEGVIFLTCDQPFITPDLLQNLVAVHKKTGSPIVGSSYETTIGIPAFFHKKTFPELMALQGDIGAKRIIRKHATAVKTVPFPAGIFDVDTASEYEKLLKSKPDFP